VVPYYGALKILFDRTIAFFAAVTLAFYPLHVIQSSVTTSDAVYYFFLFGAFYYLFGYRIVRQRLSTLVLSALSFNIASLLRFESWIFIPVFFILLWPKGKKPAFLFLLLSMVFPCGLFALNQFFCHDLFYSFHAASRTAHAEIATGWGVVIGGLSGIVLAFLMRQKRQLSVFFLLLWLAFTINTLSAGMIVAMRYSIILGLFLIPYAWFFVDRLLNFLGLKRIVFFILILLSILAIDFGQALRQEKHRTGELFCITPPGVINVGRWLKDHVRADETLIISNDPGDGFQNNIMLRSEISHQRCLLLFAPLFSNRSFIDKKEFERYIWEHRTTYLVLNSESSLQKIINLDLSKRSQDLGGAVFEVAFEEDVPMLGKHIIYRISYREPSRSGSNV
jgi:hypothetical protein